MTLPTVPLIDGAYYWVRASGQPEWLMARYENRTFHVVDAEPSSHVVAVSGPIPTPDEVE